MRRKRNRKLKQLSEEWWKKKKNTKHKIPATVSAKEEAKTSEEI